VTFGEESIMTPILPPYPFPEKWSTLKQEPTFHKWCIPPTFLVDKRQKVSATSDGVIFFEKDKNFFDELKNGLKTDEVISDDFCYVEDGEQFLMNEVWADRFSKTLKRIRRKAHKVNHSIINKHK
jgi:hypothetical protein